MPVKSNQLAGEKSPYLLQHAHNPVEWHPWGPEAFEKARREDKPIFLSVGYSTCHWCHVMERESFESETIAKLLNDDFVSIKVDREERPDVDRVYMTFVQATTGSGGWPMSVWLTPDLKPFVGGTYFPPEDRWGRAGFSTVLERIATAWKEDRAKVVAQGDQMLAALEDFTRAGAPAAGQASEAVLERCYEQFAGSFDAELGGFGSAPKFPRPAVLNFLVRYFAREKTDSGKAKQALAMALLTLRKMADGGMHDHLGGGFHRYSVDRWWHIPHFEKMLYDQAQLATAYLDAFQATREPQFERVARGILEYVQRDMADARGGFYSAEDADSAVEHGGGERSEGAFYVWSAGEINEALDEQAAGLFGYAYGVEPGGNAPPGSDPHGELAGKNTLIQRHSIAEAAHQFGIPEPEVEQRLADARSKLFAAREKRPRPHRDDKIITAWNALMISAFARAHQILGDAEFLSAATGCAQFLRDELFDGGAGRLRRSFREGAGAVEGFADDYAFLIQALIDLYEASFDGSWLQWAFDLQEIQDRLFLDSEGGGYFSVREGAPDILLRMKEDHDGAEPSPNSVAAMNLLRLGEIRNDDEMRERAVRTMNAFASQSERMPGALPQMHCALMFHLGPRRQVVIAGRRDAPGTVALVRTLHRRFLPNKIVMLADGGDGAEFPGTGPDIVKAAKMRDGKPAVYVCKNYACQLPVTGPEDLDRLLSE